ncbi:MAG: hypothetical protein FWF70_07550 [Bacteroidetes bacterium]|nr:hypothetical protein [Bacteroidota bacterium]MCL1968958.1 hypothetical protein [Bacteroidota bacterium]
MKQVVFLLLFSIFLFGYTYSQIDTTRYNLKSDTTTVLDTQEDITTSIGSISEGQSDDEGNSNAIPSLLHSAQDVYQSNTNYNFSIAYFRSRGYDNQYQDICINGFAMNSMITGRASFSQWGGLNHVVRWPERIIDMNPATFTFGNVGGATNYDLRASGYRKQMRATYSISNRTYMNRFMFTAASGIMQNGWSVVGSASVRFGDAIAYVPGTSYKGFSAFFGAEKKFNQEHALNLTAFVSPTERGMQAGSVPEAFELANSHYYNPNWGWYQGKQRNAQIRTVIEPAILLTHYFTPKNNKYTITTTLATSFGRNNRTGLNWYDVPDPRPDYYKNLPNYYKDSTNNMFDEWRNAWLSDENRRQIDWYKMYNVNQTAKNYIDSLGKHTPLRAQYMVENRIIDHFELGGASNLVMDLSKKIKLSAGVDIRGLKQHNYKTINDLLGGAYWLDVDKYSIGAQPDSLTVEYNDLNHINDTLHEGDIFGYNYNFLVYTQKAWAMLNFTYPRIDFHVGGQLGATEMWRVGFMKNGRFPTNSEGKSEVKSFFESGVKAGITYKITGRNYLVLNSEFLSNAPSVLNAFLAPRIRNSLILENNTMNKLETEKITSVDLSYIMKYPFMKMRATLYFTQFFDMTQVISFYHDDEGTMVNNAIVGMNQRHLGAELGTEIKLCSFLWLIMAGNLGDYRYSNKPVMYTNYENGFDLIETGITDTKDTIHWKNFFVAGSPQIAGTLGLKFNYKYWWVNLNCNYFDRIFCTITPSRRTSDAVGIHPLGTTEYHNIVDQTRLKGQLTLDISVSKSWRIKRYTIGFNLNITNITNNKNLVSTAWEAYRFDYKNYNPEVFQNKYYYAFGTTFFAGFNFTFN